MEKCVKCDKEIVIGAWPFCPHPMGTNDVIGDDIPGGIEIRHGLCNEDGTPRRYYSKSEIAKEAARRGLKDANFHTQEHYARQARLLNEEIRDRKNSRKV
jgi:hypothetical protein